MGLGRLRPTRITLIALIGLVWAALSGTAREFVWADLREGMISLHGLSRPARILVWTGFSLLFVMVAALLFNDLWRAEFPLLPMASGISGRGSLLPAVLVPVTLFLLSMAWSFVLAGALHGHPAIRVITLLLYILATAWTGHAGVYVQWLAWGTTAAILLFFIIRWRASSRPASEFSILLLLVSAPFVLSQAQSMSGGYISSSSLLLADLDSNIYTLAYLVTPLLFMIGLDIADFTHRASRWSSEIALARLPLWGVYAILLLAAGWRLFIVVREAVENAGDGGIAAMVSPYAGALAIPLLVGLAWWSFGRSRERTAGQAVIDETIETSRRSGPPVILAHQALQIAAAVLLLAVIAPPIGIGGGSQLLLSIFDQLLVQEFYWRLLLYVLAVVAAFWVSRRGNSTLALYLGTFGLVAIWTEITGSGQPLAQFGWSAELVDFWWVMLFTVIGFFWLIRGRLTAERVQRLLFLLLITVLLRQTDFIEDPFSPFFGFAGVGLIAFGIIWDALTFGIWANGSSRSLPRISRIFLYLGYVLLTVTLINWVLTAHNLSLVSFFTGDAALDGLNLFGKPLLYAIFAVTLALPFSGAAGAVDHQSPIRT